MEAIPVNVFYVTRCYQTRHGNGWISSKEEDLKLINNEWEINTFNEWQKEFRTGELDYSLLNHALTVDNSYLPLKSKNEVKKNLVVTCMDQRPDFQLKKQLLNTKFVDIYSSHSPDNKDFRLNFFYHT